MVDIDHAQQVLGDEVRSQNLHVAREHDQVDVLPEQIQHFPLGLAFVFGISQQVERDMIKVRQRFGGGMIADNRNDVAGQVAGAMPVQQVDQTVIVTGNQNRYLGAVVG